MGALREIFAEPVEADGVLGDVLLPPELVAVSAYVVVAVGLTNLLPFGLTLEDLSHLRQWGSLTPGHPEHGHTVGVEATTGPLGQGVGNAVGMAIAEAQLATLFNRPGHDVINHHTYFICSDGDLMEGVSHEAASIAGHLKLGKLIGIYDDNHITIDGDTALTFSDDTAKRFEAYG